MTLKTLAAALLLGLAVAGCSQASDGGLAERLADRTTTTTSPPRRTTTTTSVPPLAAEDVALTIRTISKECFGSAGCNVEYSIDLELLDVWSPRDEVYEITYEVTGGEDGPAIGTLTLDGSEYTQDGYQSASTPSGDTQLSVAVVEVRGR